MDRAEELTVLTTAWKEATAGRPRVALVRGEAGIGKSRLLTALESECIAGSGVVLHGACVSLDAPGAMFTPFRSILSELVEIVGLDRARGLAGSGAAALGNLVPAFGLSPVAGGADQQDVVARLLDKLSRETPVLVIVEDLHWADAASLGLVDYLCRVLRGARLLLAVSIRTSAADRSAADDLALELMRLPRVDVVDLPRLSPAGVRQVLRGLLDQAPDDELAQRIVARSEGVPFFVEELAAAEADGESALPTRLRDLLLRRTMSLSPPAMVVMRAAAVAGRPVDEATLAGACSLEAPAFRLALAEIADAGMLAPNLSKGFIDFRHALLREALESELLPGEAAELHRRYAELLDAVASDAADLPTMTETAHHWWRAGEPERACGAALAAAEVADRQHADREQWHLLTRTLELYDEVDAVALELPDRVDLLHRSGVAACRCGENAAGQQQLDEAWRLIDLIEDPARALEVLADVSDLVGSVVNLDGVEEAVQTSLRALPDGPSRARVIGLRALEQFSDASTRPDRGLGHPAGGDQLRRRGW